MSMMQRAKRAASASRTKVERLTGKVLGDEDMPVGEQVEELKVHLRATADKVTRTTGKALGDEDMPVKEQVADLWGRAKDAGATLRGALRREP